MRASTCRIRRHVIPLVVAVMSLVGACSDVTYVRTNPYDLEASPTLTITGVPDSTFVLGASFTAKIESDMPLPTRPTNIDFVNWSAAAPLHEFVNGFFYVTDAVKVVPTEVTVIADFGDRLVTKSVVVMQRPTNLDVTCVSGFPCDTLRSIGDLRHLHVTGHDADGRDVEDVAGLVAVATITPRSAGMLERQLPAADPRWVTFRAAGNGTTWVVAERQGVRDSIRIVVHQRLASWTNQCPEAIEVGETVQLSTTEHVDGRGEPMAVPFDPVAWFMDEFYDGLAAVSPSGELVGLAPGDILLETSAPGVVGPYCVVSVTPP